MTPPRDVVGWGADVTLGTCSACSLLFLTICALRKLSASTSPVACWSSWRGGGWRRLRHNSMNNTIMIIMSSPTPRQTISAICMLNMLSSLITTGLFCYLKNLYADYVVTSLFFYEFLLLEKVFSLFTATLNKFYEKFWNPGPCGDRRFCPKTHHFVVGLFVCQLDSRLLNWTSPPNTNSRIFYNR